MSTTRRDLAASATAATIAGTTQAQPASLAPRTRPARNVVLVHGAFADGSGWRGVYEQLTASGYRVSIVQNPLTSLADDAAATRRILDRQDGPTILVGHSWGGTVITEAGVHPKVAGLVYVSALSPDAGETSAQQYGGFVSPPEFVIDTHGDGFGFVKAENFKSGFAADANDADVAFMRDAQVPIAMSAFGTKLTQAAWRSRPSWAVIATEDKAFDLRMLRHMASRIGARVTEVAASHAVFMTQPMVVAGVVDEAAQQAASAGADRNNRPRQPLPRRSLHWPLRWSALAGRLRRSGSRDDTCSCFVGSFGQRSGDAAGRTKDF